MVLVDSTSVLRCVKTAIAAAVMFSALVVASAETAALAHDDSMVSRKGRNNSDVGIRGHGFVAAAGVFTTIDAPRAGLFTIAFGIDDWGRTVGGYVDRRGRLHGFLKDQEALTVIDFPGAKATFAARINDRGQIVGEYSEESNTPALSLPHGFLLEDGVFTRIDVPGARRTQPFGINNRGQIMGSYVDAGMLRGFLLDKDTFTTFAVPDASPTAPHKINNRDQIVGGYFDAEGMLHEFMLDKGVFATIDAPGAAITDPAGINNRGQIVGAIVDDGGATRSVTPCAFASSKILSVPHMGRLAAWAIRRARPPSSPTTRCG